MEGLLYIIYSYLHECRLIFTYNVLFSCLQPQAATCGNRDSRVVTVADAFQKQVCADFRAPPSTTAWNLINSLSSMATPFKLNCWVLGEDSTRVFTVKIDRDENVWGLKVAIKENKKHAFDKIPANRLDVWNVSIPTDEDVNLEVEVKNLKVLGTKSLSPVQPLSGIFRNALEEHLHVIVRASTGECSPDFCFCLSNTRSLAGDDELAKVGEHAGDIDNVTLYVKKLNKWTGEDLQLWNNNILLHFTFDNTQPSLSSTSNVVFPPYTKELLDGLARKREIPRGNGVMYMRPDPLIFNLMLSAG